MVKNKCKSYFETSEFKIQISRTCGLWNLSSQLLSFTVPIISGVWPSWSCSLYSLNGASEELSNDIPDRGKDPWAKGGITNERRDPDRESMRMEGIQRYSRERPLYWNYSMYDFHPYDNFHDDNTKVKRRGHLYITMVSSRRSLCPPPPRRD